MGPRYFYERYSWSQEYPFFTLRWVHLTCSPTLSCFITRAQSLIWDSSRCWLGLCSKGCGSFGDAGGSGENRQGMLAWWSNMQGQDSVCFYSSLSAACSSSWDQLQDVLFSLAASVWGQWWEMRGDDVPEWTLLFGMLSVLRQTFFQPPSPCLSQIELWQDFMWTCHVGDPDRHGAVFRVTGQDCGSVQEQESCNLGKSKAQGKFGNKRTKVTKKFFLCWQVDLVCFLSELSGWGSFRYSGLN